MAAREDDLLLPWVEQLREQAPGIELFDAHTHFGENDPDGYRQTPAELDAALRAVGARGVVFPMHEPGGYPPANDLVIEEADRSSGRLVPFCRLDPRADPLEEAQRALGLGARGIKLHPRSDSFGLDIPELDEVFALAGERRLPVLVHAGRGIPALGRHAVAVCERHPGLKLILAHAAISDLAWLPGAIGQLPNLFIDTSWWAASDLLALFSLVGAGQILFASDSPYAPPAFAAHASLRCALQAGLSEEQLRLVFGAQLERILAGDDAADGGAAVGAERLDRDPLLDRINTFLLASVGQMFNGLAAEETLSLARLACEVGADSPHAELCATILKVLDLAGELAATGERYGRPERFSPGLSLVVIAATLARTPDVAPPPLDAPAGRAGERSA